MTISAKLLNKFDGNPNIMGSPMTSVYHLNWVFFNMVLWSLNSTTRTRFCVVWHDSCESSVECGMVDLLTFSYLVLAP